MPAIIPVVAAVATAAVTVGGPAIGLTVAQIAPPEGGVEPFKAKTRDVKEFWCVTDGMRRELDAPDIPDFVRREFLKTPDAKTPTGFQVAVKSGQEAVREYFDHCERLVGRAMQHYVGADDEAVSPIEQHCLDPLQLDVFEELLKVQSGKVQPRPSGRGNSQGSTETTQVGS